MDVFCVQGQALIHRMSPSAITVKKIFQKIKAPCFTLLSAGLLLGCVTLERLDAALDKCMGMRLDQISYPSLAREISSIKTTKGFEREYALTLEGNCRWKFLAHENNVVIGWEYPNERAARYCRSLATTRP